MDRSETELILPGLCKPKMKSPQVIRSENALEICGDSLFAIHFPDPAFFLWREVPEGRSPDAHEVPEGRKSINSSGLPDFFTDHTHELCLRRMPRDVVLIFPVRIIGTKPIYIMTAAVGTG